MEEGKRDGDGEKERAITLATQAGSSSYSHGLVPAGNHTLSFSKYKYWGTQCGTETSQLTF